MTTSGSSYHLEVGLLVDQGFDTIAQYAIVLYEEDLDSLHAIDLSPIRQRPQTPGQNASYQYEQSEHILQFVPVLRDNDQGVITNPVQHTH